MTHHPPQSDPAAQGFTLVEILIVLVVMGLLMGILAPPLLKYKQRQDADNFMAGLAGDFNVSRTRTMATGQVRRIRLIDDKTYVVENQAVGASTWTTVKTVVAGKSALDMTNTLARTYLFDTRGFMVATTGAGTTASTNDVKALSGSGQKTLSITALGLARRQ